MSKKRFIWIVCVVAVATGLVTVWLLRQPSGPPPQANHSDPANKAAQPGPATSAGSGNTNAGYVTIAEWHVRFPVPAALRGDVYYGIRNDVLLNDAAANGQQAPVYGPVVYFASHKIVGAGGTACDLSSGAHNDRTGQDDPASMQGGVGVSLTRAPVQLRPDDRHVGGAWYEITASPIACSENSDGTMEQQFVAALITALKDLEPI